MNIKNERFLTHSDTVREFKYLKFTFIFLLAVWACGERITYKVISEEIINSNRMIQELTIKVKVLELNNEKLSERICVLEDDLSEAVVDLNEQEIIKAKVTAYTPSVKECDSDPFITASNKKIGPGQIAVSRDLFFKKGMTFGKKVYIEGLGIFKVNDLMPRKHRNAIDVVMFSERKALKFGVKHKRIALLEG